MQKDDGTAEALKTVNSLIELNTKNYNTILLRRKGKQKISG